MDFVKEWFGGILAGAALAAAPMLWRIATAWAAKKAGEVLAKMVDKAIEKGDDDWDRIIYAVAAKVESEIDDDLSPEDPTIKKWAKSLCEGERCYGLLAGRDKEVAQALSALLKQIDQRAKRVNQKKGRTGPGDTD